MPLLLGMMGSEEKIKMKAQVVSCAVSFVTNLTGEPGKGQDDIDPEEKEEGKAIITQYSQQLVEAISVLFQLSIEQQN